MTYPQAPDAPEPIVFHSFDGTRIAYREVGKGRATVLLHGILSDGAWAWFGSGHAQRIAALGRRVIAPDLREHGRSAAPHDPAAYDGDALARDQEALVEQLSIQDFDVVGYSLGTRTAIRWMLRGARPGRAVLGGLGDAGVTSLNGARFARLIDQEGRTGDPADLATWGWLKHAGFDPLAIRALALAQGSMDPASLGGIDTPALVVMGTEDRTVGSADALARMLGRGVARSIPGDHVQAVASPAFAGAIIEFLGQGA